MAEYLAYNGPRTTLGERLGPRFLHVPITYRKFSDGTDNIEIGGFTPVNIVAGSDVVFCMSMADNDSIVQCLHVLTALLESFVKSVTIVCPFVPCATMERVDREGTVATANTTSRLFSGLPSCGPPTRFICYDLHTLGHRFYFHGHMVADLRSVVRRTVKHLATGFDVIVFPDEGAKKRYKSAVADLGIEVGCCTKVRDREKRIVKVEDGLDVKHKMVLIIDDLVRTGGTLKKCADALKVMGASDVSAFCVHAAGSLEELMYLGEGGALDSVILSDSCGERLSELAAAARLDPSLDEFFDVVSIGPAVVADITRTGVQDKLTPVPLLRYAESPKQHVEKEEEEEVEEQETGESVETGLDEATEPLSRVIIASMSALKEVAVAQGFNRFRKALPIDVVFRRVDVRSGVPSQPMTEKETCMKRLDAAYKLRDLAKDRFIVSIKNGLDEGGHDFAWVMVFDVDTGRLTQCRSASVPVPYTVRRAYLAGGADAYAEAMSADLKDPHTAICGISRQEILAQAVAIAIGQHVHL